MHTHDSEPKDITPGSGSAQTPLTHKMDSTESQTGLQLKIFAMTIAIVLLVGFLFVHHKKSSDEDALKNTTQDTTSALPEVTVISVQHAPASFNLSLPGETTAWYDSIIYARVDGYVAHWNADIGDHVQKGSVLASIETPDLDAQLLAAQAKLKAAKAMVLARQADADFAASTYDRWKDSPTGVVSDQEREAKKAAYDSALANLNEAQAQVGLDEADIERYTALNRFKQVISPYDGTITERHIDIGNLVTAGSTASTTPLYRMVQDNPLRVFVDVPQSAANDIKTNLSAQVTASNIPNRVFVGKVTRTSVAINQQTRTLHVEVDIPNTDHALVPGMYVNVGFNIASKGLPQVPAAALSFRSGGPQVAVLDSNNKVSFHKVTIARDNGNTVELDSGVATNDRIAVNISSQITEGETVAVHAIDGGTANAETHAM